MVAAAMDKTPAIDDAAGISSYPPSQLVAVNFASFIGNVTKHLTQFDLLSMEKLLMSVSEQ